MNVPNVTMLCTSRQTTPKGTGRTHRMNKLEEKEKGTGVTDMSTVMTYEEKRAAAIARGAQQAYQAVNPTWLPLDEYKKKMQKEREEQALPTHEWRRKHMKFDSYLQKMVFKTGHGYDEQGRFYEPNGEYASKPLSKVAEVKGRLVNYNKGNIVNTAYDDAVHSYGLKGLLENIAVPQSEERPATQQRKRDIAWKTCNLIGQPMTPDLREANDDEQFQTTFEDWSIDLQRQDLDGNERIYDGDKVSDGYGMDVELRTYLEDNWLHSDDD